MRCCCCNNNLNDYESTLKSAATGQFLDMCKKCLQDLDIQTLSNPNEPDEASPDEEYYWDFPDTEFNPVNEEADTP